LKNKPKYFLFALFACLQIVSSKANPENQHIDSLRTRLKQLNATSNNVNFNDTLRINTLIHLSVEYALLKEHSKAIKYANISKLISEKLVAVFKNSIAKKWLANTIQSIGFVFEKQENYAIAIGQYKKELELRQEIGDKAILAKCLNKIGELNILQDNIDDGLDYYFKALTQADELNFKKNCLPIYTNIGHAYKRKKLFTKSLNYYNKALLIAKSINNNIYIAEALSNIGIVYAEFGNNKIAKDYFFKYLNTSISSNNKKNIAQAYLNLSNIYEKENNLPEAIEAKNKALKLFEEIGNHSDIASVLANIGASYLNIAKTTKNKRVQQANNTAAKNFLNKALMLFQALGQIENISETYFKISEIENINQNFNSSLNNYKLHVKYHDSLLKLLDNERSIRAEINYEFTRKENAVKAEQERKEEQAKKEKDKQQSILNLFVVAFIFMIVLIIVILKNNRTKQKAYKIISEQKIEVEHQKSLIEKNRSQILASINYAKRIQESILISEEKIIQEIPEFFISYLPKDIVSGDFYWFSKQQHESFIVLADCTGHGVPGAFLSMVGSTLLNEIINHNKVNDPAKIISTLSDGLKSTLINKHDIEFNSDGMDISICKINHNTKKLYFAGVNQSIFVAHNGKVKEIPPQINSIHGIFDINQATKIYSEEINLNGTETIYLTSDGYLDQIGATTNKKFLAARFSDLICEISDNATKVQKEKIESNLKSWKRDLKQTDDILVIGFKI